MSMITPAPDTGVPNVKSPIAPPKRRVGRPAGKAKSFVKYEIPEDQLPALKKYYDKKLPENDTRNFAQFMADECGTHAIQPWIDGTAREFEELVRLEEVEDKKRGLKVLDPESLIEVLSDLNLELSGDQLEKLRKVADRDEGEGPTIGNDPSTEEKKASKPAPKKS